MKKKLMSLLCVVFMVVMMIPATAFADDIEDENVVEMTPQEVSEYLLMSGVGFNKLDNTRAAGITNYSITLFCDNSNGRIAVLFSTKASSIANTIGISDLALKWGSTTVASKTIFDQFKQQYSGGYYYLSPVAGRTYYATGEHFAYLGTTRYAVVETSRNYTY